MGVAKLAPPPYNFIMLSQRNRWLLIAVPIALILLWAAQQRGTPSNEGAIELPPPLGRGLIYLSPADGTAQLFHIDLATAEIKQLAEADEITSFDLSADGGSLVYSEANAQGGSDLWLMDLSTRQPAILLDCGAQSCSDAAFSVNGDLLAYQTDFAEIWLLDMASGEREQVSPEEQLSREAQWSADGRLSYYVVPSERYELVLPGNTNIDLYPNQTGERLSWAADGESFVAAEQLSTSLELQSIAEAKATAGSATPQSTEAVPTVSSAPGLGLPDRLVSTLMRYSSNEAEPLFDVGDNLVEDTSPTFSPDGRWLAFTRKYLDEARWTPGRQLWLFEMESGLALAFSDSPNFHISAPVWSADSSQIAFLRSNRIALNEPLELWVIQVNGSGARLLAVDAFAPQWIP